jgi:CheY-like chemotaxis protein
LRTPLNPVLMTVADLEHDPNVPAAIREQMTVVRRNVELEARLIDDLLDSTRIANGKLQLQRTVVDAQELLRRAIAIVEGEARTKGVHLEVTACERPCLVDGDPARLQQVFWNVVKNAVKFTPEGGWVRVSCELPASGTMRVAVQDNGVGIAREDLGKIFNAFEQGDTGITHRFGGLGLGLAISKALVALHEGELTAESEGRGHGATFTIELPLTQDSRPKETGSPTSPAPHHALRLLIVEDHDATSTVMARLLKRRGYAVTVASSLHAALATLDDTPIDILISDLGLPDGTGGELMRRVREKRDLPGIALSGYGSEADVGRSREDGFDAHLTKPIDIDRLDRAIQKLATETTVRRAEH